MRVEFSFLFTSQGIVAVTDHRHASLAQAVVDAASDGLWPLVGASTILLSGYTTVSELIGTDLPTLLVRFVRDDAVAKLTPRQYEVADIAAAGATAMEIARHLNISIHTVRQHLQAIYRVLDIGNRIELAQVFCRVA